MCPLSSVVGREACVREEGAQDGFNEGRRISALNPLWEANDTEVVPPVSGRGSGGSVGSWEAMHEERLARGSTWRAGDGGVTFGSGGNFPLPDLARGVPRHIRVTAGR